MSVSFIPLPAPPGESMRETPQSPAGGAAAPASGPEHASLSVAARNEAAALLPLPAPARPHYFPVSQLTLRPVVLQDIPANLALDLPDAPAQAAVLRLLINEHGGIDKVIVDESSVPESAAQAIAEAFRSIRFRPGELEGTPVKSQLKIQIVLESMAQPSAAAHPMEKP
jgi:hypothetical protein